ncbi:MAG: hypothetical protein Q7O66_02335 [Dehalococcoidia bacterium]|nr:hypothetical protein [Dehalococcoidia bacterium]
MIGAKMSVLDPTAKRKASGLRMAPRPEDLSGKTVGLVDNGEWWMTEPFLQRYGELLKERCGVAEVIHVNRKKDSLVQKHVANSHGEPFPELESNFDAVILGLGN